MLTGVAHSPHRAWLFKAVQGLSSGWDAKLVLRGDFARRRRAAPGGGWARGRCLAVSGAAALGCLAGAELGVDWASTLPGRMTGLGRK